MRVIKFPDLKADELEVRVDFQTETSLFLDFNEFFVAVKKYSSGHYKLDIVWHDDLQENIFHFWKEEGVKTLGYSYDDGWRGDRKKIFWHMVKPIWSLIQKYDSKLISKIQDCGETKLSWKKP